jgi:hypothetical protein
LGSSTEAEAVIFGTVAIVIAEDLAGGCASARRRYFPSLAYG